jgi:cell division protease FtsH
VDDEVKRIVEEAHGEAIRLLTEHRSRLDGLADELLREETLDQRQAYAAAGLAPRPDNEAARVQAAVPVST